MGFFDECLGILIGKSFVDVWVFCESFDVYFIFKCVDMCVVEFEVCIFYMYFCYELFLIDGILDCEFVLIDVWKVVILGGGFNWIG